MTTISWPEEPIPTSRPIELPDDKARIVTCNQEVSREALDVTWNHAPLVKGVAEAVAVT